jgi:uncharacterized membrane protein YfcA
MQSTQMRPRPSNGRSDKPLTRRWQRRLSRRALWVIAAAISLAATVAGGGVFLWAVYREARSPSAISVGATLFVFGFCAVVVCFGVWVASSGHRKPESGHETGI